MGVRAGRGARSRGPGGAWRRRTRRSRRGRPGSRPGGRGGSRPRAQWGHRRRSRRRWAWTRANPVRVETSFARPGGAADGAPSFDAVFRDAPAIAGTPADSARLRAYAVRLRDLTAARDGAALYDELAPSVADRLELAGRPVPPLDSLRAGWEGEAAAEAFPFSGDLTPFEAGDVQLRSWVGGRVWELYRDGADGLLQRAGRGTFMSVYVGEGPGGELRVVR